MIKAYQEYWKGYIDFKGRTSVSGYWWAVLANFIVSFAVSIFANIVNMHRSEGGAAASIAFTLLCLLPSLSIAVRRLRDAGCEWTNLFWTFLPIAGSIILIVKLCKPSSDSLYQSVSQPVSASGAPVYQTYSQPVPQQASAPSAPVYPTDSQSVPKPPPTAGTSILDQYKAGLSYLNSCGGFDEAKFREFNRITGHRFSEGDIQKQLLNAKMMLGGMEDVKKALRSGMVEAIQTFEELERKGIDLSKYNI